MHMDMKVDTYEDEFEEFSAIATAFARRGSLPLTSKNFGDHSRRAPRRTKSLKTPRKRREEPVISPLARLDNKTASNEAETSSGSSFMSTLRPPSPRYGLNSMIHSSSAPSSRSGSWKKSHRPSLGIIETRPRTASLTTEEVIDLCMHNSDSDICPVRSFKTSSKGIINRGDSVKYKSDASVASSLTPNTSCASIANSSDGFVDRSNSVNSGSSGTASEEDSRYSVLLLGKESVGKTTLSRQFLTSEHIGTVDSSFGDDESTKSVTVLLDGEETNVDIYDTYEYEDYTNYGDVDAYVVVYSITDRESYDHATDIVHHIRREEQKHVAVIVVANKGDLVRFREVSQEEARDLASTYDCKYIEVSAALNLKVDELLVGLVHQVRLNPDRDEKLRKEIICKSKESKGKSVQKLARGILARFFKNNGFGSSKSCDNLMVL